MDNVEKFEAVCKNGTYVGFREDGVIKFLGIPFARVKRWQRALPVTTTASDVIECLELGPTPFQDPQVPLTGKLAEDALNLNLYAADLTTPKKAVMVWVTGGAEIIACNAGMRHMDGSVAPYNAATMVRENPDVIVLSINYRVGFWGTINLTDLEGYTDDYKYSANLARLDLLDSLKWVRDNIAGFGGDPDNVTLFGQSAGSNNITSLMFMEEAIPYVQNAICASSFAMDISLTKQEDSRKVSAEFFKRAGVKTLQEALALSNDQIYAVQSELNAQAAASHLPGVESKFLSTAVDNVCIKEDYWSYLMSGALKGKTIVFGTNSGEYDMQFAPFTEGPDLDGAREMIIHQNYSRLSPEKGTHPELLEQYLTHHRDERDELYTLMDMKTDLYVRCAGISFAKSLADIANVYVYFFQQHKGDGYLDRCHHGREMEGLFDYPESVLSEKMRRMLRDIWTSVARNGDPNCSGLGVTWEKFGKKNETLRLSETPYMADGVHMDDVELLIPAFREYEAFPEFKALWN